MLVVQNSRCPRCGGNLYVQREIDGDVIKCLPCGYERDINSFIPEIPVEEKPKLNITQEVINVGTPEGKSPGQLLYEKHAAEVGLTTKWSYLGLASREGWERKARGEVIPRKSTKRTEPVPEKTGKSTEKVPAAEKNNPLILPTWDQMKGENDAVKIAWFHAWEIAWAQFWRSADGK